MDCPSCWESTDAPRALPCGHLLCLDCLQLLQNGDFILCSACGQTHHTRAENCLRVYLPCQNTTPLPAVNRTRSDSRRLSAPNGSSSSLSPILKEGDRKRTKRRLATEECQGVEEGDDNPNIGAGPAKAIVAHKNSSTSSQRSPRAQPSAQTPETISSGTGEINNRSYELIYSDSARTRRWAARDRARGGDEGQQGARTEVPPTRSPRAQPWLAERRHAQEEVSQELHQETRRELRREMKNRAEERPSSAARTCVPTGEEKSGSTARLDQREVRRHRQRIRPGTIAADDQPPGGHQTETESSRAVTMEGATIQPAHEAQQGKTPAQLANAREACLVALETARHVEAQRVAAQRSGRTQLVIPPRTLTTFMIKNLTGHIFHVIVEATDSVAQLKDRICQQDGIPPDQQRLIHNGRELQDERPTYEYGIQTNDLIHLVLKLRGD